MNTKEKIEVMQGYEDGKPVECNLLKRGVWTVIEEMPIGEEGPIWDWYQNYYRIKPEPREFWLNIYEHHTARFASETMANNYQLKDRIECIKVREVL